MVESGTSGRFLVMSASDTAAPLILSSGMMLGPVSTWGRLPDTTTAGNRPDAAG